MKILLFGISNVGDKKRGKVIKKILQKNENMGFAISPISYSESFVKFITAKDILTIELFDSAENIFNRLVFSDVNDVIYRDDEYKNKSRNYYINEINEDFKWYGNVYAKIGVKNKFNINNDSPEIVVQRLIKEFELR